MAYKQYTHCTPTSDFKKFDRDVRGQVMGIGGLSIMIAGLIAQALVPGYGIYFVLIGSAPLLAAIIMTFEFLLGGKLICLGGDKLAIGKVISVELPDTKNGVIDNIDNDLSINILLCPYDIKYDTGDTKESAEKNFNEVLKLKDIDFSKPTNFQDFLVQEQPASSNHGVPYTNYESMPFKFKPNFHIELEGARISNMYAAFLALWALLVIAALASLAIATIPGIGWLLALLLMLIITLAGALLGLGVAALTYVASSDGSLDDVDPSIGVLHPGDLIIAYGTWTYDSGHNYDKEPTGWNELHPVKFLSKGHIIKKDAKGYPFEVPTNECLGKDQAVLWEEKIKEALSMPDLRGTVGKDPLVGSSYHPLIDGCEPQEGNPDGVK
jgi:hypothetical protein